MEPESLIRRGLLCTSGSAWGIMESRLLRGSISPMLSSPSCSSPHRMYRDCDHMCWCFGPGNRSWLWGSRYSHDTCCRERGRGGEGERERGGEGERGREGEGEGWSPHRQATAQEGQGVPCLWGHSTALALSRRPPPLASAARASPAAGGTHPCPGRSL